MPSLNFQRKIRPGDQARNRCITDVLTLHMLHTYIFQSQQLKFEICRRLLCRAQVPRRSFVNRLPPKTCSVNFWRGTEFLFIRPSTSCSVVPRSGCSCFSVAVELALVYALMGWTCVLSRATFERHPPRLYEAPLMWPTRKSDYLLHAAAVELVAFCSAFTKIDTDNNSRSTDTVCSIFAHYVRSSRSVCRL